MTRDEALKQYEIWLPKGDDFAHALLKEDLFCLLLCGLGRSDINNDWLYDRCREVEGAPDGYLDLWAREHFKSSIITVGLTIQEVLKNPEITIGIFSHSRGIAKSFLRQIKREFEGNRRLQVLFPHIMPPARGERRTWSEDEGLVVQRRGNPKEATIEAWGLVDGQPIGRHFDLLVYDDVVTPESVLTQNMIEKTTNAFVLSTNLGTRNGRARCIGTRYHHNDTYATLIERQAFKPRIYAATRNGQFDGEPVFLSREELDRKRQTMGSYIFGCQMLQSPSPDEGAIFKKDWIRHWTALPKRFDRKLLSMDCAFKDKADSDYVVAQCWGQSGADAYLIDQIRGRWDFVETLKRFVAFVQKHPDAHERLIEDKANGPAVIASLRHDIPGIIPVEPTGSKSARAFAVSPHWESGNVYIPHRSFADWTEGFEHELLQFPVVSHDDQVDAMTQALHRMHEKRPMVINPEILKRPALRKAI